MTENKERLNIVQKIKDLGTDIYLHRFSFIIMAENLSRAVREVKKNC